MKDTDILLINPGRKPRWGLTWMRSGALDVIPSLTPDGITILTYDEMAQKQLTPNTLPHANIIYALTGLTPSRPRAEELARMIRDRGGLVVAGGMDIAGQFTEGFEKDLLSHFNAIAPGRLTRALWVQILSDASRGSLQKVYMAKPNDPWEWVVPRHDLARPKGYFLPASIRSSAGCTEKCPFCTVHLMGGLATVHLKPREILEAELRSLPPSLFGVVVDNSDSFGCVYDHTVNVVLPSYWESRRPWFTEITIKNLMGYNGHPPLLWKMADSGCAGVYIGIESIDHAVSGKSLKLREVEKAIFEAHRAGLIVLGSFVLDSFDSDDAQSVQRMVAWAIEQRLEFTQYSLVAALPGSQLRRVALSDGRIIDFNPVHYDGAWPTVWRPFFSAEQRIGWLAWAYQETYSKENIRYRLRHLRGWQHTLAWAANWQIHRIAKSWRRRFDFPHWLATREPPPLPNSDPS